MRDMLTVAGFTDVRIQVKENAADIIKDWMPGSGAEKVITSAYVTATKPQGKLGLGDNVHADTVSSDLVVAAANPSVPNTKEDGNISVKSSAAGC